MLTFFNLCDVPKSLLIRLRRACTFALFVTRWLLNVIARRNLVALTYVTFWLFVCFGSSKIVSRFVGFTLFSFLFVYNFSMSFSLTSAANVAGSRRRGLAMVRRFILWSCSSRALVTALVLGRLDRRVECFLSEVLDGDGVDSPELFNLMHSMSVNSSGRESGELEMRTVREVSRKLGYKQLTLIHFWARCNPEMIQK